VWMVSYYELIHRLAWYLSLSVSGLVVLFLVAALVIRVWRDRSEARDRRLRTRWREQFESWLNNPDLDEAPSDRALVPAPFVEQHLALQAWLEVLEGASRRERQDLVRLAEHMMMGGVAHDQLAGSLEHQLVATRVLGRLSYEPAEEELEALGGDENLYLAAAAHEALIRHDPARRLPDFLDFVRETRPFGYHFVARMFERLEDVSISRPLTQYVSGRSLAGQEWMLLLLEFADPGDYREVLGKILEASGNDELIANALRLVRRVGADELKGRVVEYLDHGAWFVRLQAAITLGEIGDPGDGDALIALLGDDEWWVRYRAAQALRRLTDSRGDELERLREKLSDEYARDILTQVMAE